MQSPGAKMQYRARRFYFAGEREKPAYTIDRPPRQRSFGAQRPGAARERETKSDVYRGEGSLRGLSGFEVISSAIEGERDGGGQDEGVREVSV